MKILIDIKHPAQLNLFKNLSRELENEGWDVTISYLERGKLPKIIEREYKGFKTIPVGSSKGTKWSILWNGNVARAYTLLNLVKKDKYNICVAASSIPLAIVGRLTGVPVVQFYDDPERTKINYINAKLSSQLFFPPIVEKNKKTGIFNCLKEWSYLSPNRFNPNRNVLAKYGVNPHEYVFIREVSNKSFNYYDQDDAIICKFSSQMDVGAKVLLSLEDKTIADKFPKHWQILEEPVDDIHSLIYYSKLVVSSGDSMAREGAMLGVPSVYCGIRKMKANKLLMDLGLLEHLPQETAIPFINKNIQKKLDVDKQTAVRNELLENWDDMNAFMKKQITNYKK